MSSLPSNPEVPIILPKLGTAPVRLSIWFAEPGDRVYEGDRIVEVSAGGATFDVAAPATGRLATRLVIPRDELQHGQVLGFIAPEEAS